MTEKLEHMIREIHEHETPSPEIREDVLRTLPDLPRRSPAAGARPVLWLVGAAAAAAIVIVSILLGRPDEPAGETPPVAAAGDVDLDTLLAELREIPDGLGRVRHLVPRRRALEKLDEAAGLRVADTVLEAFPWRDRYVDREHQKDLFAIRDLVVENDLRGLSWLFVRLLDHANPYVRLHALQRLADLEASRHAVAVQGVLDDLDDGVRAVAAQTLLAWDARGRRGAILRMLREDPEWDVRRAIARACGDRNGKDVQVALVDALDDLDPRVRAAAASSLEQLGATTFIRQLRHALATEQTTSVAEVLESTVRSLERLRGARRPLEPVTRHTGPHCGVTERERRLVTDEEGWAAFRARVPDLDLPRGVDFRRQQVLVILGGTQYNCRGYTPSATEDDAQVVVRLRPHWYQTMGGADAATPWLVLVLPRRDKPVIVETNVQGRIGGEPVWAERARFPPR